MAYMVQQAVTTAARDAYRERADAAAQADEAARVRAWLQSLALDRLLIAALVEPVTALEEGLREAAGIPASRPVQPPGTRSRSGR